MKLSAGPSAARKAVAGGLAVPTALVAGAILWLVGNLIYETVAERPVNLWGELVPHLIFTIIGLMGVYVLGAGLYLMLGTILFAQTLDGTMLTERVVLWKRVDLATAEIDADYNETGRRRVQTLIARAPVDEAEVRVPIGKGSVSLPAGELTALADAITSRRRSDPDSPAFVVADQLRQLVSSTVPFPPAARTASSSVPPSVRSGEPLHSDPSPAGSPEPANDPHRTRNSALAVAIVFVPLLGGCVVLGFVIGRGPLGVVVASILGLSIVLELRRVLKKHQPVR